MQMYVYMHVDIRVIYLHFWYFKYYLYSWKYETWFAWMRRLHFQKLNCEKKTFELRFCVIIIVNKLRSYCKKNIVIGSIAPSLQMVFLRVYPTLWAFHRLKQLLESPQAFDFNYNVNGRSSENYGTLNNVYHDGDIY